MPNMPETDVAAVCERLRAEGVDVVRVSYPDMIGVDRGRDVLVDELPAAAGHGLAFCRAVYHTSPMGDVVPVQGGLEAGLPDIHVHPDLATLAPLPWEPNAAWCLGDAVTPDGSPAPESPRVVVRRVAEAISGLGYTLICGPELEFYLCQRDSGGGWQRYADELGNVYVVGHKGDPEGLLLHMLRQLQALRVALVADHIDVAQLVGVPAPAAAGRFPLAEVKLQLGPTDQGVPEAGDRLGHAAPPRTAGDSGAGGRRGDRVALAPSRQRRAGVARSGWTWMSGQPTCSPGPAPRRPSGRCGTPRAATPARHGRPPWAARQPHVTAAVRPDRVPGTENATTSTPSARNRSHTAATSVAADSAGRMFGYK